MFPRSIVARSALVSVIVCAFACTSTLWILYQIQKVEHEERVLDDFESSIQNSTKTLLGYFYLQGNWVHLDEHLRYFKSTPNTLYTYIVDANGIIDVGIDGIDSSDVGSAHQPWEHGIADHEWEGVWRQKIVVDESLAKRFPDRIVEGDSIYLLSFPFSDCCQLRIGVVPESIGETLTFLKNSLAITGVLLSVLLVFAVFVIVRRGIAPIRKISSDLDSLARDIESESKVFVSLDPQRWSTGNSVETDRFRAALDRFTKAYQSNMEIVSQLQAAKTLGDLSAQVAHDLRAPLAACDAVYRDLETLPDSKKKILRGALQSMKDTANKLLAQYGIASHKVPDRDRPILVAALIDEIIAEMRSTHDFAQDDPYVFPMETEHMSAFVQANRNDFKRVLTNIICNAKDATNLRSDPLITVSCALELSHIVIKVKDNGCGIPETLISKIYDRQFTYGKVNGSGLGLAFVKEYLASHGGQIWVDSVVDQGTVVTLRVPATAVPGWHQSELDLSRVEHVVICDDNEYMCKTIQDYVERSGFRGSVTTFQNAANLLTWMTERRGKLAKAFFLIDYELVGSPINGDQIIVGQNLQAQSLLVTALHDDPVLQDFCARNGVRILAKSFLAATHIRIEPSVGPLAILLDDNLYTRLSWKQQLDRHDREMICVATPKELFSALVGIPTTTPIFIDENLGDAGKGSALVPDVKRLGFLHVYLATGEDPMSFSGIEGLSGVIGKEPPPWLVLRP